MSGVSILAYNRASINPYTDNRIVNRIFWAVGGAVALIALGSFTLSFTALYDLAVKNSVPAHRGWIWPLIVDLSIVIYTAAILVAQLQRRGAKLPVALTIFYALVTVTGNLLHAPATPLGWFVAALPPLSLILGSEILRTMGHHLILQQTAVTSLTTLKAQIDTRQDELEHLTKKVEQAAAELTLIKEATNAESGAKKRANESFIPGDLEALQKANDTRQAQIEARRAQVMVLLRENLSLSEIAARLTVSPATIRRDRTALNGGHAQ
jgi:hypothetical protein